MKSCSDIQIPKEFDLIDFTKVNNETIVICKPKRGKYKTAYIVWKESQIGNMRVVTKFVTLEAAQWHMHDVAADIAKKIALEQHKNSNI